MELYLLPEALYTAGTYGKQASLPICDSIGVYPEVVDCGPDQSRSEAETAGVAALGRGFQPSENAELDRKMPFLDGH